MNNFLLVALLFTAAMIAIDVVGAAGSPGSVCSLDNECPDGYYCLRWLLFVAGSCAKKP